MFGVFPFGGPYFGQAVPLVQVPIVALSLCETSAVSLMPTRTAASLMPVRTAIPYCEP